MAIDTQAFPMNVLDLKGKKVLLRPEAVEGGNRSNVVIGELRKEAGSKEMKRQVTLIWQPNGQEVINITIKKSALGGATTTFRGVTTQIHEAQEPGSRQVENKSG